MSPQVENKCSVPREERAQPAHRAKFSKGTPPKGPRRSDWQAPSLCLALVVTALCVVCLLECTTVTPTDFTGTATVSQSKLSKVGSMLSTHQDIVFLVRVASGVSCVREPWTLKVALRPSGVLLVSFVFLECFSWYFLIVCYFFFHVLSFSLRCHDPSSHSLGFSLHSRILLVSRLAGLIGIDYTMKHVILLMLFKSLSLHLHPPTSTMTDREENIYFAKLAEQAERCSDNVLEVGAEPAELGVGERNFLSVAFIKRFFFL